MASCAIDPGFFRLDPNPDLTSRGETKFSFSQKFRKICLIAKKLMKIQKKLKPSWKRK
jgi:hypothetical protein